MTTDAYIPLPWQQTLWQEWYKYAQANQLSHALLIEAPSQSGKTQFIREFAQLMLCTQPLKNVSKNLYYSCNQCTDCKLYCANTHPNTHYLGAQTSTTTKRQIVVEQIRNLTQALEHTASQNTRSHKAHSYHTVVIIDAMEILNITAQNAFLKTLEEPLQGVLFILASTHPQALLPTIRSRCQCYALPKPTLAQSRSWMKKHYSNNKVNEDSLIELSLKLANNIPPKALQFLESGEIDTYRTVLDSLRDLTNKHASPVQIAAQWSKYPIGKIVGYLMQATAQLIEKKLVGSSKSIESTDYIPSQLVECTSIENLFGYWDLLQKTQEKTNLYTLNALITLEMLAYRFSNSFSLS